MTLISQKTKETNTFRYKSFGERINAIDLRRLALYNIGHQNEELHDEIAGDQNGETYYHQTLKKWLVLNMSEEFTHFSRKCIKIVTLPQLLHQKDYVIDLLLEHLATATNLSQQPLLELLYVLARDLREEFYVYFQRVLDRLLCLLQTQDPEQLEWTLICLAYLFKTLKPYLKRNIGIVFHAILPLLDAERYDEYVTNFAVECFAYIARDIRDFRRFLTYILRTVIREQVECVRGCGRLIYEMMRGVKGQLHSHAAELMQYVFESLLIDGGGGDQDDGDEGANIELLSDIVQHAFALLLQFLQPDNMTIYWQQLCAAAAKTQPQFRQHLLSLILLAIEHKDGRFVCELNLLTTTILQLLDICMINDSYNHPTNQRQQLQQLVVIISKLLQASSIRVTQLDCNRLIQRTLCLQSQHADVYEYFVILMLDYQQFELLILPHVISYFEQSYVGESTTINSPESLLAQIVLHKQPLTLNAVGWRENWHMYPIMLKQESCLKKIEMKLNKFNYEHETDLLTIILLPHLRGVYNVKTKFENILTASIKRLLRDDKFTNATTITKARNFKVFGLLLRTHLVLDYQFEPKLLETAIKVMLPHIKHIQALSSLQLLLEMASTKTTVDNTSEISAILAPLLSQHNMELRQMAAHCLQSLHNSSTTKTPYQCIYQAACINSPTVHNYRELLLQLGQLDINGYLYKSFQHVALYKQHVVQFLLGLLYIDFKLIWQPILKLLSDYAKEMKVNEFWSLYKAKLCETADYIEQSDMDSSNDAYQICENDFESVTLQTLLLSGDEGASKKLTQQQAQNYRQLLWQNLTKFEQLIEIKNADLVSLFLTFIDNEYRKHLEGSEFTWDLSATESKILNDVGIDDIEESDVEIDENEKNTNTTPITTVTKHKKLSGKKQNNAVIKTLFQTLEIKLGCFACQVNPKAFKREPEMHAFYLELLAVGSAQLQKLALECLFAYKTPALLPYKDQLLSLIDEQQFKTTLTQFRLDEVQATHREVFMQHLLRLLYGKMLTKGAQRQLNAQQRKTLILRFLGQLSDDEIFWFLKMAFGAYETYIQQQTLEDVHQKVSAEFDLRRVHAAKQLQRIVNLLELIRKEFAGRMDATFQFYVFKLLIFVGSVCQHVQQTKTINSSKIYLVYKNLKSAALQTLVNYFAHIDNYNWTDNELTTICRVYVWPTLDRLSLESIHTPTPLLKLLLLWGEHPKHHKYLQMTADNDGSTIFHHIIQLLLNDKAKPVVRRAILTLIEQLLVAAETPEYANVSLSVFQPYIADILLRLKLNFRQRSPKQDIDKRDLNILTLLTAYVHDESTCSSLLDLLLPILITKTSAQTSAEIVCQVITTLTNLVKRLNKPESYIRSLSPLWEQVHEPQGRKMLCQLLRDIAIIKYKSAKEQPTVQAATEAAAQLTELARLVSLLNACDKRWIEQPDYDKRLQALNDIKQKLVDNTVQLDLGALVIYNCFYFLRNDKDLGLRVNVSEHLRVLLPKLIEKYANDKAELSYLMDNICMKLIQRSMRDTNDNVRNECIGLLGVLARQCPDAHEVLRDLSSLSDSQDSEVDFFENITHLQTHRHGRALQKFCTHAASLERAPCVRTLTQFLLPLSTRYLMSEKYTGKHTLIDAAIEAVGVICQLLPWQQYHALLRYYLYKLRHTHDHQKQCVRIVVRILDAFHYDLSQAQTDAQALQKLKTTLLSADTDNDKKAENNKKTAEEKCKVNDEDDDTTQPENSNNAQSTFDDPLDDVAAADETVDDTAVEATVAPLKAMNQILLLTPNAAGRVMTTITTVLIPTLNRAITEKSSYDNKHKVNRRHMSSEREEAETLRVPISLALVKLMQKLPKELLDNSVPGVFMKVCTFLRSPLKSVRMLTRDILKKIMVTLGGSYLDMLMDHLQSLLTRGFQVHVLSVTLHGVLDALRAILQPEHIEACLHNILEVALNDIFGEINAEKDVNKIVAHAPEAKTSAKSYLTLHIAARNIRENCLLDILMPFKKHLALTHSRKVTLKIQECFGKIVAGFVENPHLSRESLLIFIYGTMSESIKDLLPGGVQCALSSKEKERMRRAKPDCYLIPAAPGRRRIDAQNRQIKSNTQANAHILIEFGLEMLHIILKRKKLIQLDYQPLVQPILPLLRDALKSTHIRVTTFALKCFATLWHDEYDLPTLQEFLADVVTRMFEILSNFSTFGATKQEDNARLVKSAFKAIVSLLRKRMDYVLTDEQIEQLTLLIDQELHDSDQQPFMCFALLKALIARKVSTKSFHEIMKQIGDLSVISHSDFVRDESRNLLITYMMEYPLHKHVDQIVKFMSQQLCYTLPSGRLSVIEFMSMVIRRFPLNLLVKRSEFLYLTLGTRLVNDNDPKCRQKVAEAIESLLSRLTKIQRQPLFEATLLFFEAEQKQRSSVREMAAALLSRFLVAEKTQFSERLPVVLPIVVAALTLHDENAPGRFVRAPDDPINFDIAAENYQSKRGKFKPHNKAKNQKGRSKYTDTQFQNEDLLLGELTTEETLARRQRAIDHETIQIQYCLLKMFEHCGSDMLSDVRYSHTIDELAYTAQKMLAHDHNWVRCNAAKLLTCILSHYDFVLVGQIILQSTSSKFSKQNLDFIYMNPAQDIKSLVLDLCAQVIPGETAKEMIDEIVKIFLYIANMLRDVPFRVSIKQEKDVEEQEEDAFDLQDTKASSNKINLNWLVRNMRYLINKEVAKAPHCISTRSALFTLFEALTTLLSVETLIQLASSLLLPLVREMSDEDQTVDAELRQQALRVGSRLRKQIGTEVYDRLRNKVQTKLMQRRADRRKFIAQEKLNDPERAAKRKAGAQERKKTAKRLKTAVMRGKIVDVKQKLKKRKRKAETDIF